ncbi:hypothetical protein H0X48_01435 [Candidatus Dependentiae bacterium]|nr:hypothetical protein [Candidatus Dependentiae bacterium]
MESLNPLEKLNLLEKKIASLVELLKTERELNSRISEEKAQLAARLEIVETSLLKGTQSIEELNQERVLTKMVVDELICSIDRLVEHE